MRILCRMLAVATFAIGCNGASANNSFFIPGDAFFPTSLTAEELDSIDAASPQTHVFHYKSYGTWGGAFCGYAGYQNVTVENLDAPFLVNLRKAQAEIRKKHPRELVESEEDGTIMLRETNPICVMFYRSDVPFGDRSKKQSPRVHFGLRYNEDWVEETVKFGHSRHRIRMCHMVDDADAIETAWRDADAVPELPISVPKDIDRDSKMPGLITGSVKITGDIKAIVIPADSLLEYYRINTGYYSLSNDYVYHVAYVVDSNGITKLEFEHDPIGLDDDIDSNE